MQSLDAALAFAITMLILAMVVTTLVETLHRVVGLREKGLALLLANLYQRVLVSHGAGLTGDSEECRQFVEMMTVNRGPVGSASMTALARSLHLNARSEDRKFLSRLWSGRRLGSLSPATFMERLGSSQYGARLVMQVSDAAEDGLELLLKDLVQKFDAFGNEASEYFESRARLLSVLVGLVLAVVLNVNAITLFETFMKRPDVTQKVIANSSQVTDAYRSLQQRVEALDTAVTAAAQNDAAAADAATRRQIEQTRAQVRLAAEQADTAVKNLQAVGVPIGWNAQSLAAFQRSAVMGILGLLLGGLLIGLGAPFWYQAVETLTGIRGAARKSSGAASGAAAAPAAPSAPNQSPATPIDAFHAAFGAVVASGGLRLPEEAVG